jgi:hypothetical protein
MSLRPYVALLLAGLVGCHPVGMRGERALESRGEEGNRAGLSLVFSPKAPRFAQAANEYSRIWSVDGKRIERALEHATGATLGKQQIRVVVYEAISYSGSASEPMVLRASYPEPVKRAALVHELTHRYLDLLSLEGSCFADIHEVVDLVLIQVWSDLWGREFAENQTAVEMSLSARYKRAWVDVLVLNEYQVTKKLQRILRSCRPHGVDSQLSTRQSDA